MLKNTATMPDVTMAHEDLGFHAADVADASAPADGRLVDSVRTGLWVLIVLNLLLAVVDLRLAPEILPRFYLFRCALLLVGAAALVLLKRCPSNRSVYALVMGTAALACAIAAGAAVVADDALRPAVLCLGFAWGAAVVVPWGARFQAAFAAITGLSMFSGRVLMGGTPPASPDLATAAALAASIIVAHHYQQRRLGVAADRAESARLGRDRLEHAVAERTAQLRASGDALSESERRLRTISELTSDYAYAFRVDAPGSIELEWVSEAPFVRITGFTLAEVQERGGILTIVHEGDRALVAAHLESLVAGNAATHEFRIVAKSGEVRWVRDYCKVEWDAEHRRVERVYGAAQDITSRKLAAQALLQGERRFRALIERSLDLVSIHDRDGTFLYANGAFEAVFGCKSQELIGSNGFARVHPVDVQALVPMLAEAVDTDRSTQTVEYRLRHQDGSWRSYEGVALNLLDDPEIAGILITGRDITERKRAEERNALLQFAHEIGTTDDLERLLELVQLRAARALHCGVVLTAYWQAHENAFRIISDHGCPDDMRAAVRALKFGASEPYGGRLVDGETILYNDFREAPPAVAALVERFGVKAMIAAPMHVQGRYLGSLTALRMTPGDPFESHQADLMTGIAGQLALAIEALQLQRRQREDAVVSAALARVGQELISSLATDQLLDRLCATTAAVLECDASFTMVSCPDEQLYRVAAVCARQEDVEGARGLSLPEQGLATLVEELARCAVVQVETAHALSFWGALPARYGIGVVLYVALRQGGKIIGIHAAGFYGERARFTEQQERIARGMAEMASFALENARLFQQLEGANKLKSEFLATMSHELLTPLNVIIGYTDLFRDGQLVGGEQQEGFERIRANAGQLLHLVHETLDLSRLETGRVAVEYSDVDLVDLVRQVDCETRDIQGKSDLKFEWNVPADLPRFVSDPLKLLVVLKNLIGNAVKFTERGTVALHVLTRNGGIEIAVADTGIGITGETLPIIFEAFRQGDSSSTRQHGGVGLGLHIVRRLVEALGGAVSVDSEVGRGSTFRVWLPCAAPPAEPVLPRRTGSRDYENFHAAAAATLRPGG